jgi:ABC-type lipoprotein release transport system permease subunit
MTVGNAVMTGMRVNMENNVAKGFTGDIVVISSAQEDENLFMNPSDEYIEAIGNYSNVRLILEKQNFIDRFLPMGVGKGFILENETPFGTLILGVNFADYQKTFGGNLIVTEGRSLANGETGLVFNYNRRYRFYQTMNRWLLPNGFSIPESVTAPDGTEVRPKKEFFMTELVFMGVGKDSVADIRLPVTGIAKYRDYNYFLDYFTFLDIDSFRRAMNYIDAEDLNAPVTEERKNLLRMDDTNLDSFFSGSELIGNADNSGKIGDVSALVKRKKTAAGAKPADSGVYNTVSVLLKKGFPQAPGVSLLNAAFKKAGVQAKAVPWQVTFGSVYKGAELFRNVVSGFIFFLYFVVIVVMMNALNMAVIERTVEIAMMRSIGASKGFIGRMFLAETELLSLVFGTAGILLGTAVTSVLDSLRIAAGNSEISAILFSSDYFHPIIGPAVWFACFAELALFTSLAVLYPVRLAVRVKPLEAIAKD